MIVGFGCVVGGRDGLAVGETDWEVQFGVVGTGGWWVEGFAFALEHVVKLESGV